MSNLRFDNADLFHFTPKEFMNVGLLSLLFSFGLTFRMWGGDSFDPVAGATNWIIVFIGMLTVVFLHEAGHKLVGAWTGHDTEIVLNNGGIIASIFVTFYFFGYVPFITPNLLRVDARPERRMHHFFKYDNPRHIAYVAMGGIAGTTVAIMLFNTLNLFAQHELFGVIIFGAVLHGVYSLIPFELFGLLKLRFTHSKEPITPGDGLQIWWGSRNYYLFTLIFMILFGLLAMVQGVISYVVTAIIAGLALFAFNKFTKAE